MFESKGRVDDFGTNANECKDLILLAVRYAVRYDMAFAYAHNGT